MLPFLARHANRLSNDAVLETDDSELNVDVPSVQEQDSRRSDAYNNVFLGNLDSRMLQRHRI